MPFKIKALSACPKLEYYDSETGSSDKIVLLLTANPGHVKDYDAILPILESKGFHVFGINWPSYGESSIENVPDDEIASGASYFYKVLVQFVEDMQINNALLIGNSVGGYCAIRLAYEHPERVSKVVAVSTGGFSGRGILTRFFCNYMSSFLAPSPKTFANFYLSHKSAKFVQEMLDRASKMGGSALKMNHAVWASFPRADCQFTSENVQRISAPVLLIFGKRDPVIRSKVDGSEAKRQFANKSNVQFVELDSGHCPFAEIPDDFLKEVDKFLQ
jgi:pimeloyl-ACP methyl ester carboxylesterase